MLTLFYYFFLIVYLIVPCLIVFSKNPIHVILYLILFLILNILVLLYVGLEFNAFTLLIIYVGAIAVLFLFIVMMLNIQVLTLNESFLKYLPIGIFILLGLVCELFLFVDSNLVLSIVHESLSTVEQCLSILLSNFNLGLDFSLFVYPMNSFEFVDVINLKSDNVLENIGIFLYDFHGFGFVLSGLILLISIVGSIMLTLTDIYIKKTEDIFKKAIDDVIANLSLGIDFKKHAVNYRKKNN